MYVGAVGLQPFLVFCVFVFCKNTVFPLETGYFVHFSVSPFLSPWLLSLFLFHSLSLLFLVFFVYSLLYCWFLLLCFFVVLSCLVSLRLFHEKNITFERFLFINYFCFLGVSCFALPFKSLFLILFLSFFQLCVLVNIHVFIFQRRTFLKHSVLFCALCKVIVFVKGRFWGQIRLMFEKHCKNRHFSTRLRALWSKQIRFSRVEGLGLRLLCGPGESVRVQAPKQQNIKNKHADIGVFCGLIMFLVIGAGPLKWLM